jgi:hypothetical protein
MGYYFRVPDSHVGGSLGGSRRDGGSGAILGDPTVAERMWLRAGKKPFPQDAAALVLRGIAAAAQDREPAALPEAALSVDGTGIAEGAVATEAATPLSLTETQQGTLPQVQ